MGDSARRARIAVINDDTDFLDLLRDLLQEEHFEVLICKDQEWDHVYQFVKDEQPDLVIQDIRIGGEEHGWTILNLLTLDPVTRSRVSRSNGFGNAWMPNLLSISWCSCSDWMAAEHTIIGMGRRPR